MYHIFEKKKGPIDVPGSLILRPMFAAHPYNHFLYWVPPRGVLRFELDRGVPLEAQNPYPSLRVILAEKGTHFKGFFLKNRPIFQKFRDFQSFRHAKTQKVWLSQKSWPMFKDFLVKKRDPCLRISCKKATH